MTYKDVYKKFMIEYDKADISSSYPSLTIYEVATLLDKAMLALIAQKVTGNNPRRQTLDLDMKGVADLQPLIQNIRMSGQHPVDHASNYKNEIVYNIPISNNLPEILYILSVNLQIRNSSYQGDTYHTEYAQIIPKMYSDKFKETETNKPWIKHPVCCVADNKIHLFLGNTMKDRFNGFESIDVIMSPSLFTTTLMTEDVSEEHPFPLSDTMCEELINLAIIFACRTVGDPRISTEMQTKSLES